MKRFSLKAGTRGEFLYDSVWVSIKLASDLAPIVINDFGEMVEVNLSFMGKLGKARFYRNAGEIVDPDAQPKVHVEEVIARAIDDWVDKGRMEQIKKLHDRTEDLERTLSAAQDDRDKWRSAYRQLRHEFVDVLSHTGPVEARKPVVSDGWQVASSSFPGGRMYSLVKVDVS